MCYNPKLPEVFDIEHFYQRCAISSQHLAISYIELIEQSVGIYDSDELKKLAIKIYKSHGLPTNLIENFQPERLREKTSKEDATV